MPVTRESKYQMHREFCGRLNDLYVRKNQDYGDALGKGIDEDGYLPVVHRMSDKLIRAKTLLRDKENSPAVRDETVIDTLIDLANYALILASEYTLREGA